MSLFIPLLMDIQVTSMSWLLKMVLRVISLAELGCLVGKSCEQGRKGLVLNDLADYEPVLSFMSKPLRERLDYKT